MPNPSLHPRSLATPRVPALLLLLSVAPLASADPTGAMAVGRYDHMAAKLPSGRVLVAGGTGTNNTSTATAELYDAATGTFSYTGPLVTARSEAGIATLPDGRVLVVGGVRETASGGEFLRSAEIYDPATANWTVTAGSLTGNTLTTYPTTVSLPDGHVLVIDGSNSQIFDPPSGMFTQAIPLTTTRYRATAALLPDGRVLLAGGQDTSNAVLASADVWNPATNTWSPIPGAMATPRQSATATRLADGRILVAGGSNPSGKQASAEIFDPATQTFAPTGALAIARSGHQAIALADGSVLVAGGYTASGVTSSLERYYPATGAWSSVGALATARNRMFTATLLDNGNVLFTGGPGPLATAEIYVAGSGNVPPVANFSQTISNLTVTFTDASSDSDGSIASRTWNFGDGTTSTATSPVKTYAAAGTYSVSLSVTDNAGATNTVTKSISVGPPPNVAPVANFSSMTSGLTATFTDSSSDSDGTIVSRSWNFGDGTTSTATSPSQTYAAAGTYSVTLTVTDNAGASASKTASVTVVAGGCGGTVLCNGVAVTNLSAAAGGTTATYTLVVPAGATNLSFVSSGGTGDADLYVKFGSAPTTTSYDCRPYVGGNAETCTISNVQAGTYYVVLRAFTAFSGVSLTGSYTTGTPGCSGTVLCNGVAATNLSAASGQQTATYTLVVPAGATNLKFVTSGGVGDADLYVKFGSAPTVSSYDCRPYQGGNAETCTIANVQAGTYYVMLRAYSSFNGVSLTGSYTAP